MNENPGAPAAGMLCEVCGREESGDRTDMPNPAFCWARLLREGGSIYIDERCISADEPEPGRLCRRCGFITSKPHFGGCPGYDKAGNWHGPGRRPKADAPKEPSGEGKSNE